MKKFFLIAIIIISIILIATALLFVYNEQTKPIGCQTDAKICPDGSAVGRTGPKCEFEACPGENLETGTIKGKVLIGPNCPVEQEGISCEPSSQAYTSKVIFIYNVTTNNVVTYAPLNSDGSYLFKLIPGNYRLELDMQGVEFSKDLPYTFIIDSNQTLEFNFSIDTGIR